MDARVALAGIRKYGSVVDTPLNGIVGFNIFQHNENKKELVLEQLHFIKQFCEVYRLMEEDSRSALKKSPSTYAGLKDLIDRGLKREDWTDKISKVEDTIDQIVGYYSSANIIEKPSPELLVECKSTLREFRNFAKARLSKAEYEAVLYGRPPIKPLEFV